MLTLQAVAKQAAVTILSNGTVSSDFIQWIC